MIDAQSSEIWVEPRRLSGSQRATCPLSLPLPLLPHPPAPRLVRQLVRHSPKGDGGSLGDGGWTQHSSHPIPAYASACQPLPAFSRNLKLKTQNSKFNESLANSQNNTLINTSKILQKMCNIRTISRLRYAGVARFNASTYRGEARSQTLLHWERTISRIEKTL